MPDDLSIPRQDIGPLLSPVVQLTVDSSAQGGPVRHIGEMILKGRSAGLWTNYDDPGDRLHDLIVGEGTPSDIVVISLGSTKAPCRLQYYNQGLDTTIEVVLNASNPSVTLEPAPGEIAYSSFVLRPF